MLSSMVVVKVVVMLSSPLWGGCGGGNGFIHPLWCGCGGGNGFGGNGGGNAFIHPHGVAVVVVMVVVMVIRLQGHVEVLGARLTSTRVAGIAMTTTPIPVTVGTFDTRRKHKVPKRITPYPPPLPEVLWPVV